MYPMALHHILPCPFLLVTITLELHRILECSRLLSQYPLEAFFSEVLCWTTRVHTKGTSTVWKERILFITRGGRLSCWSVFIWKVSVLFLQGTTLFLKKYKKYYLFTSSFGSLLKIVRTAVTDSMALKSDKQIFFSFRFVFVFWKQLRCFILFYVSKNPILTPR